MEEVREIAERGGMKLWLADYHLEASRLAQSTKKKKVAAERHLEAALRYHSGQAKALIEECGYHRRDGEVRELMSDD
jgi:hypothetical protein